MINLRPGLSHASLEKKINKLFEASAQKLRSLEEDWSPSEGAPVYTIRGKYTSRGWTEWTQGFQFGSAILQFDATRESHFLDYGREMTVRYMAPHLTHQGVHDHGFNNVSTYGNLLRLINEGRIEPNPWERRFYELALMSLRRRAGHALDLHCRRRRLHLLFQRPAFALRRHHSFPPRPRHQPQTRPRPDGRKR